MLSFVDADASIVLHEQAHLVVRHAAFYTPFRGWHQLNGVPSSERPPSITGVRFLNGGGTVAMDHLICKGLKYCLVNNKGASVIKNSLFVDNYEAISGTEWWSASQLEIKTSVFFRNDRGINLYSRGPWTLEGSLFLQNNYATDLGYGNNLVSRTAFAQNGLALRCGGSVVLRDVLFYGNDISMEQAEGILRNVTFLDNRLGLKTGSKMGALDKINFLGPAEYHFHYTGTALYDLDASLTYWNTSSVDEMEEEIYDALDGSGKGVVQILQAESMPHVPFHHGMYEEDVCAGQCLQHWFNSNWSSLISAGAGTFGFFDPERSLNSGQVLREALLTGHTTGGLSLSSYMQDVVGLLEAVAAFQTVGTTKSPLPSTTPSTTTSTTSTTTTLASHLIAGADIVLTEPIWLMQNTTWTSDAIRALAKKVEVLPGVTLTIEGTQDSLAVLASGCLFLASWWVSRFFEALCSQAITWSVSSSCTWHVDACCRATSHLCILMLMLHSFRGYVTIFHVWGSKSELR